MLNKVTKIILGIRYAKTFRIPDIDGQISDDILYGDKTPFGPDYFPQTTESANGDRLLFKKDSDNNLDNFLRINTDDLIFSTKVENFDSSFDTMLSRYLPFLIDNVFCKYNIKKIRRVGIIFSHELPTTTKLDQIVKDFSKNKVTNPNSVRLNFTEKLAVTESQYKKGVDDFKNTIYSIAKTDDALFADLDYQHHFSPDIEDIRDAGVDKIAKEAKSFLVNNFHSWLKDYAE